MRAEFILTRQFKSQGGVNVESYYDLMFRERIWSWSCIGIVYLIVTLVIRQFLFSKVLQETKNLDPNLFNGVKRLYLKNSVGGWIVYSLSFFLVVAIWIAWKGEAVAPRTLIFFSMLLPILYFLSIILHYTAFSRALLAILRQKMGVEREF